MNANDQSAITRANFFLNSLSFRRIKINFFVLFRKIKGLLLVSIKVLYPTRRYYSAANWRSSAPPNCVSRRRRIPTAVGRDRHQCAHFADILKRWGKISLSRIFLRNSRYALPPLSFLHNAVKRNSASNSGPAYNKRAHTHTQIIQHHWVGKKQSFSFSSLMCVPRKHQTVLTRIYSQRGIQFNQTL